MCGIVAYSGKSDQVLSSLLLGLKRLEYRGYDSSGVAFFSGDKVFCEKAVGKVSKLEDKLSKKPPKDIGQLGIAHTRWATHGLPTLENAHPQGSSDGRIWVVHNGIIENHLALRKRLEKAGITFASQTDTEVVAQLINSFYKNDLRKAVLEAASLFEGTFALGIISKEEPDRLIGVKMASPLVVGIAPDGLIVASDVSAIVEQTKKIIYLEDGELVDIKNGEYEIINLDNEVRDKLFTEIDWDVETATKAGFDHYLIKEIMEQPRVIEDSIRGRLVESEADIRFGGLFDIRGRLKDIRRVVILGVGSSYYAALLGKLYFNALSGVPTVAEMSPEFRYNGNVIDKSTWVIAVSQSGETADTIAAITEAKKHGALVTGIVNVVGSTVSRITDAGVYNHVGPEISVASTKAFTSQSLLLLMHAVLLGRFNTLGFDKSHEIISAIKKLPATVKDLLEDIKKIELIGQSLADSSDLLYIGRQYNYPIALEGALKIKEIAYVHSEGLSGGELKHGFIALVDEHIKTVAIATDDTVSSKMLSNVAEVKARGGKVIVLTNRRLGEGNEIVVPSIGLDLLQPLVNNVALQLLAYYVAKARNLDIDQPRNLAKSVTVE